MTSMVVTPDARSPAHANSRIHGLLLAGSLRSARAQPLARSLGVPLAALPVDAHRTVLSWWIEALHSTSRVDAVTVAISDQNERALYERVIEDSGLQCSIWIDRNEHRGAGGTVRDFASDLEDRTGRGLLVAEFSTFGDLELGRFFQEAVFASDAAVLMSPDRLPSGVMYLSNDAISRIPTIGYFDLKEQLLPAIAKDYGRTLALVTEGTSHRIGTLMGYLKLIAARSKAGEVMVSPWADIHPTAALQGTVFIGRGAVVGARSIVADAVVMPGARLEEGAVVARSVVPPGATVPASARIIDECFAPLEATGRDQR